MTFAYVAGGHAFPGPLATTVVAGELVVVVVTWSDATTAQGTMTDGLGNTYNAIGKVVGNSCTLAVWQSIITTGGTTSIAITGAPPSPDFDLYRFTGLQASTQSSFLSNTATTTTTDAMTSGSITPAVQPGMLFGFAHDTQANGIVTGTGFTNITNGTLARATKAEYVPIASFAATAATFTMTTTLTTITNVAGVFFPEPGAVGATTYYPMGSDNYF